MDYLFIKSIHIVSMVAWFAGLFYLVRLFVYHTEAFEKEEPTKNILIHQYHIMETRLFKIICQPAMMLTWTCGLALIYINGMEWFKVNTWLHVKILLVIILTVYHSYNKKIIQQLNVQKEVMSAFNFRLYNELPTLILVGVILLAVYKNLLQFGYAFAGIVSFGIVLFIFAKIYKRNRQKNEK